MPEKGDTVLLLGTVTNMTGDTGFNGDRHGGRRID